MTDPLSGPLPVSVVVTNYNYERYVGTAIESALAQTYRALEVVVVDDGSTDGSPAVIRTFGDRIRTVFQENGGQASALNAGFAESRGHLILFLDSDDVLEPDAAATLAGAWREGVAKVQGRAMLVDGAGGPAGGQLPADPLPRGDVRALVLESGGYPGTGTTGTAFSRRCLERLMPIPEAEWRRAPDTYLRLLAPFVGSIVSVDRTVARVRIHGANQWSMEQVTVERLLEHLEMDARKERLLQERAADLGTTPSAGWLLRSSAHLQSRLALLRVHPGRHPFPDDAALALVRLGVVAALRNRGFAIRKRLGLAAWFVLVGLLPRRLAVDVAQAGFIRSRRPAWLRRIAARRGSDSRQPMVTP